MKKFIEVVNYETGDVALRKNVSEKSDREIERILNGMQINMSEDYFTRVVPEILEDKQ